MWEGIVGLIIGILIGGVAIWIVLRSRGETGGTSVAKLKKDNEQFREEVNEHFVQTAALINKLTDSYKEVFDHLNDGADSLVDKKAVRDRMPRVTDQEVRLRHMGASSEDDS